MRPTGRVAVVLWLCGLLCLGAVGCASGSTGQQTNSDGGGHGLDGYVPPTGDAGVCDPAPALGPGDQCDTAIDLGDVSDVGMEAVTVDGNGVPQGRTIWYTFRALDETETVGDTFHVDIRFGTNPLAGYEMDVYRDGCTPDDMLCEHVGGPVDWYVDQPTNDANCSGPAPCGQGDCTEEPREGFNTCEDDTSLFYVAVRRKAADASCDPFTLVVSNGVYEWQ